MKILNFDQFNESFLGNLAKNAGRVAGKISNIQRRKEKNVYDDSTVKGILKWLSMNGTKVDKLNVGSYSIIGSFLDNKTSYKLEVKKDIDSYTAFISEPKKSDRTIDYGGLGKGLRLSGELEKNKTKDNKYKKSTGIKNWDNTRELVVSDETLLKKLYLKLDNMYKGFDKKKK